MGLLGGWKVCFDGMYMVLGLGICSLAVVEGFVDFGIDD